MSLPEVPLLAVLPGTGGLTRVTDKRKVRRDRADVFCSLEEGMRGKRAVDWRLVDEGVPASKFADAVVHGPAELASKSDRPSAGEGSSSRRSSRPSPTMPSPIQPFQWHSTACKSLPRSHITGPDAAPPADACCGAGQGDQFWPLRLARDLDDALLDIRFERTGSRLSCSSSLPVTRHWCWRTMLSWPATSTLADARIAVVLAPRAETG